MTRRHVRPLPEVPRSAWQLVTHRDFGAAFWGKFGLQTAIWAQLMVCIILTYERTGSATWTGAVGAVQMAPQLVLALASGTWSDSRGPAQPVIAGAICVAAGCLGLVSWLLVAPQNSTSAVPMVVSSLIVGIGVALSASPLQAFPPLLARTDELAAAVGLNFIPTTLGRAVGPVAGGGLTTAVGAAWTLGGLSVAALAAAAVFVRFRGLGASGYTSQERPRFRHVLRHVRHDGRLVAFLAGVAAIGSCAEAAIVLAPALAVELGVAGLGAGWITGIFGLGGLAGVCVHQFVMSRLSPRLEGCAAMAVLAASMLLAGIAHALPAMVAGLIIGGGAMVAGITAFSLAVQARSPDGMLGRIMALWVICFAGFRPLASLALGFIADQATATLAVISAGAFLCVAALAVLVCSGEPRSGSVTE